MIQTYSCLEIQKEKSTQLLIMYCMQDTFARATHSAKRARDDRVSCIQNNVLRSVYVYMKTNQLHINLNKCAHMYFRPSLNSEQRMTCARSTPYNERLTIAVNGQK